MDKLVKYKNIAHNITNEVMAKLAQVKEYEALPIIDEAKGQYIIMTDGWDNSKRNYATLIHIQVKEDGKVWLRCDGTDLNIGQELLDQGVSPNDLVLAFHSPNMRRYTAFATA